MTELTDGVVRLRLPTDTDVPWIVDACRDPENQRWLPLLPRPYEVEDARWWLGRAATVWQDGTAAPFVIEDAAGGTPLGVIELRTGAPPADIGYWLAPEGRGRGAMTRALRLIADYAFTERDIDHVELFTLLDNVRSQRVAERAGFVRTGVAAGHIETRDGERLDAYRFELARSPALRGA
jgi:RimJ/RimL family protein N-acetyltransferase